MLPYQRLDILPSTQTMALAAQKREHGKQIQGSIRPEATLRPLILTVGIVAQLPKACSVDFIPLGAVQNGGIILPDITGRAPFPIAMLAIPTAVRLPDDSFEPCPLQHRVADYQGLSVVRPIDQL